MVESLQDNSIAGDALGSGVEVVPRGLKWQCKLSIWRRSRFQIRIISMATQIIDITLKPFPNVCNLHKKPANTVHTSQTRPPKSIPNQWKMVVASRMRFWSIVGGPGSAQRHKTKPSDISFATVLATIFQKQIWKWHLPKRQQIDTEQVPNNDAKRFQHDAKVDAQINGFSFYFFKKGEIAPNYLFYIPGF